MRVFDIITLLRFHKNFRPIFLCIVWKNSIRFFESDDLFIQYILGKIYSAKCVFGPKTVEISEGVDLWRSKKARDKNNFWRGDIPSIPVTLDSFDQTW